MAQRKQILSDVKEVVLSVAPNAEIILFGSRSRGDYSAESDWDFLILTNGKATEDLKQQIRDRVFDIQLNFDAAITCIIYSRQEWEKLEVTPLYKNVAEDGIPV